MQHWIDVLCEPRELFLAWQPSDAAADRMRWAVGLIRPHGQDFELRYLKPGPEFEGLNSGKGFERLQALGYVGYPAFSAHQSVHREGVRAALMRRLPPRHRSDFAEYIKQFRMKPGTPLSDFALLARTEAKLPSDGFSLVDPLDPTTSRCDLMLEVAGYRHYSPSNHHIKVGTRVELLPEPNNSFDPNAVQILVQGQKIGNINRLQAGTFLHWLRTCKVDATIERLNGSVDRPRAYIFVRVLPSEVRRAA
ncbi:HIRAN domain-containing protein [Sphingomonas sp.]|uniref:HIRAN domain-containing protein n=1 Tax=Sphingomonas sp. TaxID=28214 RepID=UPI0038A53FF5